MTDYVNSSYRSDTGLWHLTVKVSRHGVSAWLNLKESSTEPARILTDTHWAPDSDGLMGRIENAVYDNPDILDDYSATIIVETPRTLMVPKSELKEDGDAERIYAIAYKSRPEDVMIDDTEKEVVLFTLAPGMISFLRRTFPGARVRSHLSMFIQEVRALGTGIRIAVSLRPEEADVVAMNCGNLLSASVQSWQGWTDVAYRILNLADVYGLDPRQCEIMIAGADAETYKALYEFLTPRTASVREITTAI